MALLSYIRRQFFQIIFILTLLLSILILLAVGALLDSSARKFPQIEEFIKETPVTKVHAANGQKLAEFHADQTKTLVPLSKISEDLISAVIATEDDKFYTHKGFDHEGIIRAFTKNIKKQKLAQGGSTITQQLVKNLFEDKEKSIIRKVKEVLFAVQMEQRWSKNEILRNYLNVIYYGKDCYGVDIAAAKFFGKKPSKLSLDESALLAGVIKSPINYSPHTRPLEARKRRDLVLSRMQELGYISEKEKESAQRKPIKVLPWKLEETAAPYFIEHLKQTVISKYGANFVYKGGLTIYSTLDINKQQLAENAVKKILNQKGDPSAAIVSVEPSTGHLKAIIGGTDFNGQQFNLATQGRRQPGSAFKPFVLLAALEAGISPDAIFESSPVDIPIVDKNEIWKVANYEGTGGPPMSLKEATVYSINGVYARLIMKIGPKAVMDVARKMGITTDLNPDPAIALGGLEKGVSPLEMASAYATLANSGVYIPPTPYTRIEDSKGNLIDEIAPKGKQVISPSQAYLATLILKDVIDRGTGTAAVIARPAAGKTGTNQEYRDAWFVGYTPQLATAVWMGYPQAQVSMTNVHNIKVTGGSLPASIWSQFMYFALQGQPVLDFLAPNAKPSGKGVTKVLIDPTTMKRATEWCPSPVEIELENKLIPAYCTVHKKNGKLLMPDLIDFTVEEAKLELQEKGLKAVVKRKSAPIGAVSDLVFDQDPKAGTDIGPSSVVELMIPLK